MNGEKNDDGQADSSSAAVKNVAQANVEVNVVQMVAASKDDLRAMLRPVVSELFGRGSKVDISDDTEIDLVLARLGRALEHQQRAQLRAELSTATLNLAGRRRKRKPASTNDVPSRQEASVDVVPDSTDGTQCEQTEGIETASSPTPVEVDEGGSESLDGPVTEEPENANPMDSGLDLLDPAVQATLRSGGRNDADIDGGDAASAPKVPIDIRRRIYDAPDGLDTDSDTDEEAEDEPREAAERLPRTPESTADIFRRAREREGRKRWQGDPPKPIRWDRVLTVMGVPAALITAIVLIWPKGEINVAENTQQEVAESGTPAGSKAEGTLADSTAPQESEATTEPPSTGTADPPAGRALVGSNESYLAKRAKVAGPTDEQIVQYRNLQRDLIAKQLGTRQLALLLPKDSAKRLTLKEGRALAGPLDLGTGLDGEWVYWGRFDVFSENGFRECMAYCVKIGLIREGQPIDAQAVHSWLWFRHIVATKLFDETLFREGDGESVESILARVGVGGTADSPSFQEGASLTKSSWDQSRKVFDTAVSERKVAMANE